MLLLQRRIGESIYIGDDVKITVLDVTGRQVRLGIQAPRDIAVHREEIYNRIQQENSNPQENSIQQQDDDIDQGNASSDAEKPDSPRQHQQPSQIRYRSANPYRKNSSSYQKNDSRNDSLGNIAKNTTQTYGNDDTAG